MVKRTHLFHLLALLCACAVFGFSLSFSAYHLERAESGAPPLFDDSFVQPLEPGIAELLENTLETSSRPESPDTSEPGADTSGPETPASSQPAASRPQSQPESSQPVSSAPASSAPVSSAPPESSAPASSEPPVSSEESSSPSSEETSSEETSSEEASSEETSSEETSSEDVSSEPESSDVVSAFSPEDEVLLDRIAGAVQREIVGVNTPPNPACTEAYKAQAVAAHTYMEYHYRRTGSYPAMSYTTPDPRVVEMVREVLYQRVYYKGALINATYHAASGGHTQSALYVWGNDVPYLQGVDSAYDSYDSSCRVTVSNMEDLLLYAGITPSGAPEDWFDLSGASYTDGDFIDTIPICGVPVSGRVLRENILGATNLKSPKIVAIDCDGETFTFYTRGFGHGVGLSQQGALGYAANEGWDYISILTHYYPGAEVY